eukprot:262324_1
MGILPSTASPTVEAPKPPNPVPKVVPWQYKDPITKKIMREPVMVLSSMRVYENTSIRKWMESKRCFDPSTGIPMALHKWPILLEPRPNLKQKIAEFISKNPSFKSKVFKENDESIEWESLFASFHTKATRKYQKIEGDQFALKQKAKQIFKPCIADDDGKTIKYDKSIILLPEIPVVCIMGPARNGKSTLVNDLLTAKNACQTSTTSDVSCTKGAWIAKFQPKSQSVHDQIVDAGNVFQVDMCSYEEKKSEDVITEDVYNKQREEDGFYLLDMEGLSMGVTKFTKKLFYCCYATSNVVIWNDKEVGSDRFKNFMQELKDEMKPVAASSSKPAFLFLKRDAGDFSYKPYDSLDMYINKSPTFEWLRKMNIFSSLSGYQLKRPSPDENDEIAILNFHSKPENVQLLKPLIDKLLFLSKIPERFCSNIRILKQQINHINEKTALSITHQLIAQNKVLRWFWIASKGNVRRRRMIYAACEFDWDHNRLHRTFTKEMDKLQQLLRHSKENSDPIIKRLLETELEIFERVKNKHDRAKFILAQSGAVCGAAACVGGLVYGGLVLGSGGSALLISAALYAAAGLVGGATAGAIGTVTYSWMTGNYLNYQLGKTDDEIKVDEEVKVTTPTLSIWELDVDGGDYSDGMEYAC